MAGISYISRSLYSLAVARWRRAGLRGAIKAWAQPPTLPPPLPLMKIVSVPSFLSLDEDASMTNVNVLQIISPAPRNLNALLW